MLSQHLRLPVILSTLFFRFSTRVQPSHIPVQSACEVASVPTVQIKRISQTSIKTQVLFKCFLMVCPVLPRPYRCLLCHSVENQRAENYSTAEAVQQSGFFSLCFQGRDPILIKTRPQSHMPAVAALLLKHTQPLLNTRRAAAI